MNSSSTWHRSGPALVIFFVVVLLTMNSTQAAIPLLERTITLSIEQDRVDVALKKISQQGNFTFSYNPSILDASKIVSMSFAGMTVREVLNQLFQGAVQYKARGNYIILTKAQVIPANVYSGYVVDEATGERLKNVSVYDPISLSSAVTDAYGYFQIKIDKPSPDLLLAVKKQHYTDTVVALSEGKNGLMKIPINFDKEKIAVMADSVEERFRRFWKRAVLFSQESNVDNIQDTIHRTTQVSVFPFIGTNHRLSGNVINDYSFNIYGGYSRGVRKLEIGGLFNIVNGEVRGNQFAGIFNAVSGKVTGNQFAGIINANADTVRGAQFAGLINLNWNSSHKFSGAGLINFTNRDATGVHVAGLANMTIGSQVGSNLAGLFNLATKDAGPFQMAGLYNFAAGKMRGVQAAGLLNFAAKETKGLQMAGLLNVAPTSIKGAQVSGLLNYATRVRGLQLGVINIADSVRGIPIGFFSFVLKGYHQIEISADEIFYTNVAFRTGVRHFYNIFSAGAKPGTFKDEETVWSFGYGIGTAPRLNRWMDLNIDVTTNQIVKGTTFEGVNSLNKLYVGVELKPVKKIGFTLGVTLNGYITDTTYSYPELFTDYKPHLIKDRNYDDHYNFKMWLGGKIGVRFL